MLEKLDDKFQVEKERMVTDSRMRSLVKASTWRMIALLITFVISFVILKSWSESIAIAITSNFLKSLFYYVHERLWERTSWGRK